jgi:hypothetical protein
VFSRLAPQEKGFGFFGKNWEWNNETLVHGSPRWTD